MRYKEDPFAWLEAALTYDKETENAESGEGAEEVVCHLANGDFHVCTKHNCPHASVDHESKVQHCRLSGLTWGVAMFSDLDPTWTGRSTSSGDPDALAGTPLGGWKARKDGVAESAKAFAVAKQIVNCDVKMEESEKAKEARLAKLASKKGARCVDQEPLTDEVRKPKVQKKLLEGQAVADKLKTEAGSVLDKLTQPVNETSVTKAAMTKTDPRLSNFEFVAGIAVRKWITRCQVGEDRLDLSRYHDVLVNATNFVKQKRQDILRERRICSLTGKERRNAFDGPLKAQLCALVVALWRAAASSPYLAESRRGGDSFRPFVSGLCYSMKRGLRCPFIDDREIIPTFPHLAESLPTLRSADATKHARQLQSQSHRGISCLHRSISSLEDLEAEDPDSDIVREAKHEFLIASRICAQFKAFVEARIK